MLRTVCPPSFVCIWNHRCWCLSRISCSRTYAFMILSPIQSLCALHVHRWTWLRHIDYKISKVYHSGLEYNHHTMDRWPSIKKICAWHSVELISIHRMREIRLIFCVFLVWSMQSRLLLLLLSSRHLRCLRRLHMICCDMSFGRYLFVMCHSMYAAMHFICLEGQRIPLM